MPDTPASASTRACARPLPEHDSRRQRSQVLQKGGTQLTVKATIHFLTPHWSRHAPKLPRKGPYPIQRTCRKGPVVVVTLAQSTSCERDLHVSCGLWVTSVNSNKVEKRTARCFNPAKHAADVASGRRAGGPTRSSQGTPECAPGRDNLRMRRVTTPSGRTRSPLPGTKRYIGIRPRRRQVSDKRFDATASPCHRACTPACASYACYGF